MRLLMSRWFSLYLPKHDSLADTIQSFLQQAGYTLYNPFGLLPGKAYSQTIRCFLAPDTTLFQRILIDTTEDVDVMKLAQVLADTTGCLIGSLEQDKGQIQVIADSGWQSLSPYLIEGNTVESIQQALAREYTATDEDTASIGGVTLDSLPEEYQSMAGGIKLKNAEKMFGKISGKLLSSSDAKSAQAFLLTQPRWNSADGQKVRAVMRCFYADESWRQPDFVTLRDAYQLHKRRQRKPDARLYPGDAEAMSAVPNALEYSPIYAGKGA